MTIELVPFYCSRCNAVICSADRSQIARGLVNHRFWRLADGSIPRCEDMIVFTCPCGYCKVGLPEREQFVNAVDGVKVHL